MYGSYNPYDTGKSSKIEINFKTNRSLSKKQGIGAVNSGGAIIIIIFVVLCLTIFGLLSFTTAFADKTLADKSLANVKQYYAADTEAEKKLALIFNAVYDKVISDSSSEAIIFNENFVSSVISDIPDITADVIPFSANCEEFASYENSDIVMVSFSSDMGFSNDAQVKFYLYSEIKLLYNRDTRELIYKIAEWKVKQESAFVYTDDKGNTRTAWEDATINIWQGDSFDK